MHFPLPVDITSPKCTAIPVFRETQMAVSVVAVGKLENYSIILVRLSDLSEMLQRSTLWNVLVQ